MKFHVVGLPHTRVAAGQFESCAFTQKVRKFALMMAQRGHEVVVYSTEGSALAGPGLEMVACLREEKRAEIVGEAHYTVANWSHKNSWEFLGNVIGAISARLRPTDFVCLIGGTSQQIVADALGKMCRIVEFGIGYGGSFAPFRVFESSAWMHLTYGAEGGRSPNDAAASWWDDVIPNYFEEEAFPFFEGPQSGEAPYVGFLGRLNPDKGIYIAAKVAQDLKMPFFYAGPENGFPRPEYGEYMGELSGQSKSDFLRHASVMLCPSTYIEPFCGVAVEAQLCGTPVVSTDWGAFRENIAFGRTGFRARTHSEFLAFAEMAMKLDRKAVREWAMQFTLGPIAQRYEHYFERLQSLNSQEGWYAK